jgi:DNA adenine methylase
LPINYYVKLQGDPLKAPFPYFGGKSKVASEIWSRLGNPKNYVEPFAGSAAVLLARPDEHEWWKHNETINDYSGFIVNFYRAVKNDPQKVAQYASYPITEADLTARNLYLSRYDETLREQLSADPDFFDAKAAGWWAWGISAWVGSDWCSGSGPWKPNATEENKHIGAYRKMPMSSGNHSGKGLHKKIKLSPEVSTNFDLEEIYYEEILSQFKQISERLRRVRILNGDWKRLTKSVMDPPRSGYTGVYLDPPYDVNLRRKNLYSAHDNNQEESKPQIHEEVRTWALEQTNNPKLKIAYSTYNEETENMMMEKAGWVRFEWKADGGYGLQSDKQGRENRNREIIWFSPSAHNGENNG